VNQQEASAARLLVIDDEPQIRRFLRISLVAQGYEVLEAGSGKEGLELLSTRGPDLVVPDLGPPDLDGHPVPREMPPRLDTVFCVSCANALRKIFERRGL